MFYSSKNGYKNGAQRGLGSTAIWWTSPARPFPCKDGIPDENVQADEDPPKQSVEFPALWWRHLPEVFIRGDPRVLLFSSSCVLCLVFCEIFVNVLWNVYVVYMFIRNLNHWLVRNFYCAPQTSCMLKRWYISRDCDQLLSTLVGQFQTCVFFCHIFSISLATIYFFSHLIYNQL